MLETLADHDDQLMEQLLDEIEPPRDAVFDDLAADLRAGAVTPVLIGTADKGNGVLRLLKAIRHDAPDVEATKARLGVKDGNGTLAQVMKTIHTSHGGKLSIAAHPVRRRRRRSGADVVQRPQRQGLRHLPDARQGPVEGRLRQGRRYGSARQARRCQDRRHAGLRQGRASLRLPRWRRPIRCSRSRSGPRSARTRSSCRPPCSAWSRRTPRSVLQHQQDSSETLLSGHGEMHLRVIIERLEGRNQIPVERHAPAVPYRETIRKGVTQRGRHKKQSGGHGQFGDVVHRHQAAAARLRLPVHRNRHRRRGAAAVHPLGGIGRARFPEERAARLPGRRPRRQPCRRLVPFGRFLRHGLPDGRQDRHEGRHGGLLAGAAGTDHEGRGLSRRPMRRPRRRRSSRSGAATYWASTRGRAGRAGTSSRRRCRSPRSAT